MLSTSIMALVLALTLAFTAMLFWRRQKRENQPQDVPPETSSQEIFSDTGSTGDLTMQNRAHKHHDGHHRGRGKKGKCRPVSLTNSPDRQVIPRDHHPVSRREISDNALKVLHRLTSNGFDAYLVGGCIRDIYFDLHPKDFDVATNATPEQVRRLFRNSRVIGRRFKLVHVLFGREMIEVATFRASHDNNATSQEHGRDKSHHSDSGRILRDNVYGSMEDDALRRDFTVNALYYDARDFTVVDFCNGVQDIEDEVLRLIGDPVTRYHEDPVRMLRALRFKAKLDFTIDPETADPIFELGHLLRDIPAARMFDEILKLLQSGKGVRTFELLQEYGLLKHLFSATSHCLEAGDDYCEELIYSALRSTDKRIVKDRPVTPAFLFAALLWGPLQRQFRDLQEQGIPPVPAMQQAAMIVLDNQCAHTAIPKRFTMTIRDIWDMQYRLERRQPKQIDGLLAHPKFRAAYDFLVLREESGEQLDNAGQWWTDIQDGNEQGRNEMIRSLRNQPGGNGRKRRRRRQPRKRSPQNRNPES
ncbi:polynucleotide adenylyltransferase PcnB [Endozoicomonas montiporae]|uniref:Poly(A) polymerase I n=1 Tax=Endozoicomonas montiporae CL-33 TaxID=570277 RepID=A0A142BIK0_9GAMM|nr:polynucleotide adenylyltransferase PcnB [Endozoicomonas montiporae]AMO58576.1 tRNA nucleotidyltransferase/poly(A) polymerase [Endozoicomonas montiporae CL-33]